VKALLLGGTRFIGHHLAGALLARGHEVTLFHRGRTPSEHGCAAREVLGDRNAPGELARLGRSGRFDAVVDFCAYRPEETRVAIEAFSGRVGRFVHLSTGAVYLVRAGAPRPARESDYEGPTIPRPEGDPGEWEYGMEKRGCEDALAAAGRAGFPFTTLRLPIVHGPRDHTLRLHSYLWRALDGGPVLLPDGGRQPVRHLYVGDAVEAIARLIEGGRGLGRAFNLAMEEDHLVLRDLVEEVFRAAGRGPRVLEVPAAALTAAGLPLMISPLTTRWASFLDPGEARRELGFRSTGWRAWVRATVDWFQSDYRGPAPENHVHRPRELELARAQRDPS
jgi:nucleoside-diphosphate-sugar epimerase